MKKMAKVISILLVIAMVFTFSTSVMATASLGTGGSEPGKMTGDDSINTGGITEIGNSIITILTTIGVVASVIVLIVIGIKYMLGSPEEKAEYKKTLMPYVIGAALVFAASAIAQIVYQFMGNVGA